MRVSMICANISALTWKQTESTPSAVSFLTGLDICRRQAPSSSSRDSKSPSDEPAENESKNCSWKRQPAWKIRRTRISQHERRFYYHRLLGDFIFVQWN